MPLTDKELKKISLIFLIVVLGVLVFLIIRPVILSVLGGLILAYIFFPIYRVLSDRLTNKNLAASLVTIFAIAIIFVPLWFAIPSIVQRVFDLFQMSQGLDYYGFIEKILPTASEQLVTQIDLSINSATSQLSSFVLNSLVDLALNFHIVSLHLILVAFVFFFALRDWPSLKNFVVGISPLDKSQEADLSRQFGNITKSIVYGQIVVGILQGILSSIGLFVFGVPQALLLSVIAMLLSVIPVIGPGIVYVPVTFYLLITGNPVLAIAYLAYNIVFVTILEHVLRSHIVARKTSMSQVVVLIGMIGGLLIFGIIGLVLGPLIVAYFLTFLETYKKSLAQNSAKD